MHFATTSGGVTLEDDDAIGDGTEEPAFWPDAHATVSTKKARVPRSVRMDLMVASVVPQLAAVIVEEFHAIVARAPRAAAARPRCYPLGMRDRGVALVVCIALAGCSQSPQKTPITPDPTVAKSTTPPPPAASTAPPKPRDRAWQKCAAASGSAPTSYKSLRDVDWCNHSYISGIADLRKGYSELHEYEELGGAHDTDIFRLGSVGYGDLDGDGTEDAVIVLDHDSYGAKGGQYQVAQVYVFTIRGGKVASIASTQTHRGSTGRISGTRLFLDYQPAALRCTLEMRLVAGKLVTASDPCVDLK